MQRYRLRYLGTLGFKGLKESRLKIICRHNVKQHLRSKYDHLPERRLYQIYRYTDTSVKDSVQQSRLIIILHCHEPLENYDCINVVSSRQTGSGPTQPPVQWVPGSFPRG
jgi:hypothetical protein